MSLFETNLPVLILLGGCNGAGKTTAAMKVLPEAFECLEFLNADEIARGLSPLNPLSVRIQAGKLLIERAKYMIGQCHSFGLESTLSGHAQARLIQAAKAQGYVIVLLYFWVQSPDIAIERVKQRVLNGGHDVPEADVRRRYVRSLQNFKQLYRPLCDIWMVYDNTETSIRLVAEGMTVTESEDILLSDIWQLIYPTENVV